MPADLMELGDGRFAYAGREPAWHMLGEVKADAKTMTELAQLAGLTYEYVKTPVFYGVEALDGTWHHQFVGKSVLTKNGLEPLAIVSDGYEFAQPMEHAAAVDRIIEAGGAGWTPETALALGKGETTVFCAKMGGWDVRGDPLQDYFLVTDTVDGRHSLQICVVTLRVVCRNTLRIGLSTARARFNLNHVTGHRVAYEQAVKAIIEAQGRVREALEKLTKVQFTERKLRDYLERVFQKPSDDEDSKIVRRMGELQQSAYGFAMKMVEEEGLELTGYTAYNAVSEAVEWGGVLPKLSTKKSLVLGTGPASATLERAFVLASQ